MIMQQRGCFRVPDAFLIMLQRSISLQVWRVLRCCLGSMQKGASLRIMYRVQLYGPPRLSSCELGPFHMFWRTRLSLRKEKPRVPQQLKAVVGGWADCLGSGKQKGLVSVI